MTNEMFSVSAILTTAIVMTIFALSRKKEDTFQEALGRAGDEMLNEYIRSKIRNKWLKMFLGSLVLSGATFAGMQLMANSNPVIFGGPDGKLGIFDIFSQRGRRVVANRLVGGGFNANAVGPNYSEAWGLSECYVLDVTNDDQSIINTNGCVNSHNYFRGWPAGADSGAFFNQTYGDTTAVDFVWQSGDPEYIASDEMTIDTICSAYARITFRADADWQYSSNTIKFIWFQNTGGQMNAAPGIQYGTRGAAWVNVSTGATDTLTTGLWHDVEYLGENIGTASTRWRIWSNGVLVTDSTTTYASGYPAHKLAIKPWSGGSGNKTQADTLRFSRIVVHTDAGPC